MERVLVTGAAGFVGRKVVSRLAAAGHELTLGLRTPPASAGTPHRQVVAGDISGTTDWGDALRGCAAVVHLAARTPARGVSEERFRAVNDEATGALARQAAEAGVRLFVLMSSVLAVAGNASAETVTDATPPAPASPYGRSKLAAERHVAAFAAPGRVGVSLRPTMVYGAEASGNWRLLQRLAASKLPLPFGAVSNRRSLVSADNLADAVAAVLAAGANAPGGAFAVSDAEPVSLAGMVRLLREGMGLPPRLFTVPPLLLGAPFRLAGKAGIADSLLGDLVVDSSRFCEAFRWRPPEDFRDGIRRSGAGFAVLSGFGVGRTRG